MSSDIQGSTASTIAALSDLPSSAPGTAVASAHTQALPNGSSPFDHQHTSRREREAIGGRERHRGTSHNDHSNTSAPSTRPASRFERPYRPKNMPPANFPLSPPQPLHTPVPRAGNTAGFLHNGVGATSSTSAVSDGARMKDDSAGRYASPARFAALGVGGNGMSGPNASASRPLGVVDGLGLR